MESVTEPWIIAYHMYSETYAAHLLKDDPTGQNNNNPGSYGIGTLEGLADRMVELKGLAGQHPTTFRGMVPKYFAGSASDLLSQQDDSNLHKLLEDRS